MNLYYLIRLSELLRALGENNKFTWCVSDNAIIVTLEDNRVFVFSLGRSENGNG